MLRQSLGSTSRVSTIFWLAYVISELVALNITYVPHCFINTQARHTMMQQLQESGLEHLVGGCLKHFLLYSISAVCTGSDGLRVA